ncbi:hypothetical protein E3P84_01867 [Wallemia ichthyophaga]|nr:hypothetical protein E3P84_01867 [Wallemia ichthyophaga]TIB41621.1 hypothetical protein E3P83_01818 [Wallemia ichthyophaga]
MRFSVPDERYRNGYGLSDSDDIDGNSDDDMNNIKPIKSILKSPTSNSLVKSDSNHLNSEFGRFDEVEVFDNIHNHPINFSNLSNSFSHSIGQLGSSNDEDKDIDHIQRTISQLQLKSKQDSIDLEKAFNQRNKQLWLSIETSIDFAQKESDIQAQREAEENRLKSEEKKRVDQVAHDKDQQRKQEQQQQQQQQQLHLQQHQQHLKHLQSQSQSLKFTQNKARDDYLHYYNLIIHIKHVVLPQVSQNPAIKKACSASKRKITPKIGQLTNSITQTTRITNEINDTLNEPKLLHGESSPAYTWLLNHLSKCLLRQAETEVSAKSSTAFPLARLVMSLSLNEHPRLAEILMGRMVKKACWTIPYYPTKSDGENEEAYKRRVGRKNASETTVQYNDRMSGILALYFAILQTRVSTDNLVLSGDQARNATQDDLVSRIPPQFRFGMCWTWLAHALRPPLPTLATIPQLLATFFEILGQPWQIAFGEQARKVLRLLKTVIDDDNAWASNSEANLTRIRLLLDKWSSGLPLSGVEGRSWEN